MIRILATAFAALLGLAFGSFLNVCLSRWPQGESIVSPRSHCRNCDHVLSWWENIPLLSWLLLRGRCRNCHTAISWRYPLVELAVGMLWANAIWPFLPDFLHSWVPAIILTMDSAVVVGMFIFYWLLVALAFLDAENLWLPDRLTLSGTAFGFVFAIAKAALNTISPFHDVVYGSELKVITVESGEAALNCVIAILAAAFLILLIRWLYKLFRHQEGLGLGDAKLMALLAAWLGLPGALLAFVLGTLLGVLAALVLLANPSARTNPQNWATSKLPLGTFLCMGGIVSSLWGQQLIATYLHWAGF
jgi:leader peptidase (prepilin peptidase) / N-methyltransferase